jgi:hypothetical protein
MFEVDPDRVKKCKQFVKNLGLRKLREIRITPLNKKKEDRTSI